MNSRRPAQIALFGAVAVALVMAVVSTITSVSVPASAATTKLSPRLAKLVRSSAAGKGRAAQAHVVGLPSDGAGSMLRHGDRLLTYVSVADTSAATLTAVRRTGADIIHVSGQYHVVTAAVSAAQVTSW